ncbi:MAG: hypothetical protein R6W82_08645, partial [bacterium]
MAGPDPVPGLSFHAHLPWPLLILCAAAAAAAAAWWAYPRTSGKGGEGIRILLAALRSSSAVLLVLVLAGLEITAARAVSRPPRLGILVDTSRSMQDTAAAAQLDTLAGMLPSSLPEGFQVQVLGFDAGHAPASLPSVLTGSKEGPRSEAGPALEALTADYRAPDRVMLISDGHWTGPPPRPPREGVPVDVVLTGPREEPEGVRIAEVRSPERVWPGDPAGLEVTLSSTGLEGRAVRVSLLRGGESISDTTLVLGGRGVRRTLTLPFTLTGPGTSLFTVRLQGPGGTQERAAAVQAEADPRRVTILAARPLAALGALRRALGSDPRLRVTALTRLRPDRWEPIPAAGPVDSVDVYVIVDSAPEDLPDEIRAAVRRRVPPGRAGILLFGPGPDPAAWSGEGLEGCLPLRLEGAALLPGPWQVRRGASDRGGAGLVPSDLPDLPPLESVLGSGREEDADLLLVAAREGREIPLLGVRMGSCRTAVVTGPGAWRWEQMVRGSGGEAGAVRRMWQDLVHALASGRPSRLEASPLREVVPAGDPIGIRARLSDAGGRPVDGARIQGRLSLPSGELESEILLDPVRGVPGSYRGSFRPRPPGEYRWEVGVPGTGSEGGRVAVDPWDPEVHTGRVDRSRAAALAGESGGRVIAPSGAGRALEGMEASPVRETVRSSFRFWPSPWPLALVMVLLVSEWTLRR